MLAFGAIAASGLLTSIPSLPAEADSFLGITSVAAPHQSFTAPTIVPVPVQRDAFGITTFTLVQYPVGADVRMSSGFGYRQCNGCDTNHTGLDMNPGNGFPVAAIADGVVTEVSYDNGGYGQHVVIEHVVDGQPVSSLYAHMQFGSQQVGVGQAVNRGQVLGLVGATGQATGPHLHFEIIINGAKVDPLPWLVAHVNI